MRKFFIFTIFCGIVLQLTGCWVRFEANEHPKYSHYIGKTVETTTDIIIQKPSFIMGTIGFRAEKMNLKHKYMTLPAGSVLKITGISSRRVDPGKFYYFECQYDADGKTITFDYAVSYMVNGKWVEAAHFKFLN